jgi:multicomponent Na+:H+ antiporter subunit G
VTPDVFMETLRQGASAVLIAAGFVFIVGGVIGFLRFPDFYTRLHALTTSDGIGAVLVLVGLAIGAASPEAALKLALLAALIGALTPTLAHVAANAAHAAGLTPLVGPYTAPRPGLPRQDSRP